MLPAPDRDIATTGQHLVMAAQPDAVRQGLARLLGQPPLCDLTADDRGTAELVLAEVLNNVAEHSYGTRQGNVAVTLTRQQDGLACLVVDSGISLPDGVIPAGLLPGVADVALEDLPEGGFGWYLIRSLTRDLTYTRDQGVNRLSFILPDVGRDR